MEMCMDQSVRNDLNLLLLAGFECERLATRDPLQTWCAAVSVASRYVELRPVWSTLARPVFLITPMAGRMRSPDARRSADQVAPGCAVNTADGTAVDDAHRSAAGTRVRSTMLPFLFERSAARSSGR